MTPETYDFRKPAPLPPALQSRLNGWYRETCRRAQRHWSAQVPFTIEMDYKGTELGLAGSVLSRFSENAVQFRTPLSLGGDSALLVLPRPLIVALLAGLMGETGEGLAEDRELTAVEDSLVEYVAQYFFLDLLQASWPPPGKLVLKAGAREGTLTGSLYPLEALLVIASFVARCPFGELEWHWVLLRSRWLDSLATPNASLTTEPVKVTELIREIPARLTVQLGSTDLSLVQLAALQPGDLVILDQPVGDPLNALLGDQLKFRVWPGAVGPRQAVELSSLVES